MSLAHAAGRETTLTGAEQSEHYLLFRSGTCIGALALSDVREVMRALPIEPIADAPAIVMGLSIVRGAAAPVIHAGRMLGTGSGPARAQSSAPARFIALKLGLRSACLAVDAVLDVRALPRDQLHQAPPLLGSSAATLLPSIGVLDADLLVVLNTARVVPEAVWHSLAHTGAA
jgi:purine-binding chemotaxis protein CheW